MTILPPNNPKGRGKSDSSEGIPRQSAKVLLATGILLGGTAVASLFRGPSSRLTASIPDRFEGIVLRQPLEAGDASPPIQRPVRAVNAATNPPPATAKPAPVRPSQPAAEFRPGPKPVLLTPMDPGEPPPSLAKSYPQSEPEATPRWGVSLGMGLGPRTTRTMRMHTIADGDTLSALALRYLGSSARATEIFDVNRDILSHPEVLPIGAELKIPVGSGK